MGGRVGLYLLIAVSVMIAGCAGPRKAGYAESLPLTRFDDREQSDRLWHAVEDTLRCEGFQLDRVDRRAGTITTLPETSQQFFEFWRHDVRTSRDLWEATLNPIRRWVEVSQEAEANQTVLRVVVHKQRLSSPDRQFNSTIAAYRYFDEALPSTTGLIRPTGEYNQWLDIGRDADMEDHLLRVIGGRAGLSVAVNSSKSAVINTVSP